MKEILVVIDMQNDFITGVLGNENTQSIVPKVVEKIKTWDGIIIATKDTHFDNYLETQEGKNLPIPHCISDTEGYNLIPEIENLIFNHYDCRVFKKYSFGAESFKNKFLLHYGRCSFPSNGRGLKFTLIGVVTNICVISNAVIIKSSFPEAEIVVDASCCASNDMELHNKALDIMESLQIEVINRSVSDFLEQYEVVEQRGKIYVIEEIID